jgi:hypothetical protein
MLLNTRRNSVTKPPETVRGFTFPLIFSLVKPILWSAERVSDAKAHV